jgi:Cu(I)/Ag(I) efflux system membrane fusion protein
MKNLLSPPWTPLTLIVMSLLAITGSFSVWSNHLVPSAHAVEQASVAQKYTCPMHPHYISDSMGTCPICGMTLVPLKDGAPAADDASDGTPSRARVTIPPETIQNMGVRLGRTESTLFGRAIRSFGLVKENTRLETIISGRVAGWVDNLNVTAVGDPVSPGETLFTLYSPDLVGAQRDYLDAMRGGQAERTATSGRRLLALGIQEQTLAHIRKQGALLENVPYYAEKPGVVAELAIRAGSYIKPGQILMRIQDYGTVWLMASVAEKDLSFLKPGTPALVTFPNLSGQEARAVVDYIYPTIDSASRTGQVRLVLPNPDGRLRPGAYTDIVFQVGVERRLAVPNQAILIDGAGPHVVVSLGNGHFEPRTVRTGLSSGGRTEILAGLKDGERIVTSSQFLLDSESALRESFTKLQRLQTDLSLLVLSESQMAMADHLVDASLYIHESIMDGYDIDPNFLLPALDAKSGLLIPFGQTKLGIVLEQSGTALEKIRAARTDAELANALHTLTTALRPWILEGQPEHYRKKKLHMFQERGEGGRFWIQLGSKPLNPYGNAQSDPIPWPADATLAKGEVRVAK